jgi:hypothetical protein
MMGRPSKRIIPQLITALSAAVVILLATLVSALSDLALTHWPSAIFSRHKAQRYNRVTPLWRLSRRQDYLAECVGRESWHDP